MLPADAGEATDQGAYYKLGWLIDVPDDDANCSRTLALRDELTRILQTAGIPIDAGFRGFARRLARSRKAGALARLKARGTRR